MSYKQNVTFASKPDFLTKFLQNFDFRPCITCFNTNEENLKPKYKRLSFIKENLFSFFFEMSAFGVELMTVSLSYASIFARSTCSSFYRLFKELNGKLKDFRKFFFIF